MDTVLLNRSVLAGGLFLLLIERRNIVWPTVHCPDRRADPGLQFRGRNRRLVRSARAVLHSPAVAVGAISAPRAAPPDQP